MPEKTISQIINSLDYHAGSQHNSAAVEQPQTKSTFMDFIDLLATGLVSERGHGSALKTQTGMRPAQTTTGTYRKV